jgi:hypothetical protein
MIDGDITNTVKTARDVPQLRVALRDAAEKEVQFKTIDPPMPQLSPGAAAHFTTPYRASRGCRHRHRGDVRPAVSEASPDFCGATA